MSRPRVAAPSTLPRAAPQQRPYPRFQLRQVEGFDQVVVCAEVKAPDPVFHAIAGGQDDHRHLAVALAQASRHLEAIQARQAEIEDGQVKRLLALEYQVSIQAVSDMIHRIAGLAHGAA